MRIGIMGGTFDPVHLGHVRVAEAAMKLLALDAAMLLPSGDPPHKVHTAPREARLQMARLAARDCAGLYVCDMEAQREGVTYTVDTLCALHAAQPDVEWVYLIGEDTLEVLDSWRSFEIVAQLCSFAVVGRAEEKVNMARARELEDKYGAQIRALPFDGPSISSTDIRARVKRGETIDALVPPAVAAYIEENGLYLSDRSNEEILDALRARLKPSRVAHTLGVIETARRLAPRCGVSTGKAALAALLHDCAKGESESTLRELALEAMPPADAQELAARSVLHAPAGSVMAAREFGVQDTEILRAIRRHTIGAAQMSALDALIYTADFIEPNRSAFAGLDEARELSETDIFAAACRCAELTNSYLHAQGRRAHDSTLAMIQNIKDRHEEVKP